MNAAAEGMRVPDGLRVRAFRADDQPAARAIVLDGFEERFGELDPALNRDLDDITTSISRKDIGSSSATCRAT